MTYQRGEINLKKLKEIWQKNRVLIVLIGILIACFIAICIVVVTYFFGGSDTVYGDRLKDIDKHPITEDFKNKYISTLENDDAIEEVTFNSKGRVIYIRIKYVDDFSLVEAESKATASLTTFEENTLNYYDLNFTIVSDETDNSDGFTLMGAKNVNSDTVVWNNNTQAESEE